MQKQKLFVPLPHRRRNQNFNGFNAGVLVGIVPLRPALMVGTGPASLTVRDSLRQTQGFILLLLGEIGEENILGGILGLWPQCTQESEDKKTRQHFGMAGFPLLEKNPA